MKLENIVVYENSSDEFDIEHRQIGQGHCRPSKVFPHLPQYTLSGPITQLQYKLASLY